MDNSAEKIEKRKEKLKNWLKDRYNLIFIAILIFAIIIRFYYFNLTSDQPIWWDEADYLAYAKNLAGFSANWVITAQHNSLYPYLAAIFFKIGLSEIIVKFFLQLLPSTLSIILVYFISRKMYEDRRIALVASFLMAVLWEHLFNTMRFHIDILALFTGLLSIYVFWKGYEKKEKIFGRINPNWAIPLTVILVVLTYTIRRGYFLFAFFFLAYSLATHKLKDLLKDKHNWLAVGFGVILFLLAEKSIFVSKISGVSQTYFHPENKINLLPLGVFPEYFSSASSIPSILLYLFWIGLIILIINVLLSLGYMKKLTKTTARADIFHIMTIIITLAFFILIIRTQDSFGEGRWFFPLAFSSFICISRASLLITDYIKKYNRLIAYSVLFIMLGIGGYYEITHSDAIIKNKEDSFEGIRQASLYLKEISSKENLIISVAVPQVVYYAERNVAQPDELAGWTGPGETLPLENFLEALRSNAEAKYLLVSFSQIGHPDWMTRTYANNGQIAGWEISFMDTRIDFVNQKQDIKQSKSYEDVIFNLLDIKQDVFIYEIKRQDDKLV